MPTESESPRPRVRLLSERPIGSRPSSTSVGLDTPSQGHAATATDLNTRPEPPDTAIALAGITAAPSSTRSRPDYLSQMIPVLMAIAAVVAARLLLMLALCASFVLSFLAIRTGSTTSLIAATSFSVLVVIPLVWLAWQKG